MKLENIKLCVGASTIWSVDGWHVLDHKLTESTDGRIAGDAISMDLPDNSCDIVFCSHMFEHIPHVRLPLVISEINRVLKPGGVFRVLTPDLERVTKAYVEKDVEFFKEAKAEDPSLREDLGMGGMLMNFIVSPGQDTLLLNRGVNEFIAGYAHLYSYDLEMLGTMLKTLGFTDVVRSPFNGSSVEEMREPMHVSHLPAVWENMNNEFYEKYNLVHRLVNGVYEINFKTRGFDRDPLTSLIIECRKEKFVDKDEADRIYNQSNKNYNRYAKSLLRDEHVVAKLKQFDIKH